MSEEQQHDEQGDELDEEQGQTDQPEELDDQPEEQSDQPEEQTDDSDEQQDESDGQGDDSDEQSDESDGEANDSGEQQESISTEEAREVLGKNEAVAVDLRDEEEWRTGHVPGARRISADELTEVDDLPDQKVIVVCEDGEKSAEVAEKLRSEDRDAVALEGGMDQWRSDDLPMQPSRDPDEDSPI